MNRIFYAALFTLLFSGPKPNSFFFRGVKIGDVNYSADPNQ